jgi:hypothetical protein
MSIICDEVLPSRKVVLESRFRLYKSNKLTTSQRNSMSLEDAPAASLQQLAGRLETLESEWAIAPTRERRKQIDDAFKALSAQIKERFGAEGQRVVDQLLAKHKKRHF